MAKDTAAALQSRTGMLVRRPVAEVFRAFVDPTVTTRFWFTHASGPLTPDAVVEWRWEMYAVRSTVRVVAFEARRRIEIDWIDEGGASTRVEWRFEPRGDAATFVEITHDGFTGDVLAQAAQARDSTEGFALVLAGLKAWLEHGVELQLVRDRHPPAA
jgi:uncharacterized protein YndB with AHSA1/START domain